MPHCLDTALKRFTRRNVHLSCRTQFLGVLRIFIDIKVYTSIATMPSNKMFLLSNYV